MDNESDDPRNISDQNEEHSAEARGAQVELSPEEREDQVKSAAPDGGEIQDLPDQPWFLNIVVEVETELFPRLLLARAQAIELGMGRRRELSKGPRPIDIDILLFGNFIISTSELEVPHPRMSERRFVLEPLAELAPDLRHPATGKTVREMLANVQAQIVKAWQRSPTD